MSADEHPTRADRRPRERSERSEPRAGDVLAGRYEIRGLLGVGGMGSVHLAHDRDLDLDIALKTLDPGSGDWQERLRSLKREVLLARQVSHPNVCRLHDLGRDPAGILFATMELLPGETLSQHLRRAGPMSVERAQPVVEQIARGLDAAHRAGVVHRDLKCSNVMLVPAADAAPERAVLTDFGIATRTQAGDDDCAPTEDWEGTPAYMAPEQLRCEPAGPTADVYALGVMLFEMVTGRLPFLGDDPIRTARRKLEEDAPSPRQLAPDLPETWDAAILRCLARDAALRFDSSLELLAALQGQEERRGGSRRSWSTLPHGRGAFVGREAELAALVELESKGERLVNLLGMGGAGKTRLALEHAHRRRASWPGGVWFCDLSEARTQAGLVSAVASTLNVPLAGGDPVVQLGHAIVGRGRCLVVLDNFEQVTAFAGDTIGRWLDRTEDATFLVTSRERLHLDGERTLEVGSLDSTAARELFHARAREGRPGYERDEQALDETDELLARLERMPLAIELAAARLRVMTPAQISERMSDRFKLLAGGRATPRHRALRAAIDVSWDLLEPAERSAFAQCSVFDGGFTLEAAEAVLSFEDQEEAPWVVDLLQALVDKSLLRLRSPATGQTRFSMYASLQEYAAEKLDEGDRESVEIRHGSYHRTFGIRRELDKLYGAQGRPLLDRLSFELDNFVTACRRAVQRRDGDVAAKTYCVAWALLQLRGPFAAGLDLGEAVLSLPDLAPEDRARSLDCYANALKLVGRTDEARAAIEEALSIYRAESDSRAEGIQLGAMALLHQSTSRIEEAAECLERALVIHRDVGNHAWEGVTLGNLGLLRQEQGRMDEAVDHYLRSLDIVRAVGNRTFEGVVLGNLGAISTERGLMDEAAEYHAQAIAISRECGDRRSEGITLGNFGLLRLEQGRLDEAEKLCEEALAVHREMGMRRFEGYVLDSLGYLHDQRGDSKTAREHYELGLKIAREVHDRRFEGSALANLGSLHRRAERFQEAREAFTAAESILREAGDRLELTKLVAQRGLLEAAMGDETSARESLREARELLQLIGAGPESGVAKAVEELGGRLGPNVSAE